MAHGNSLRIGRGELGEGRAGDQERGGEKFEERHALYREGWTL